MSLLQIRNIKRAIIQFRRIITHWWTIRLKSIHNGLLHKKNESELAQFF